MGNVQLLTSLKANTTTTTVGAYFIELDKIVYKIKLNVCFTILDFIDIGYRDYNG